MRDAPGLPEGAVVVDIDGEAIGYLDERGSPRLLPESATRPVPAGGKSRRRYRLIENGLAFETGATDDEWARDTRGLIAVKRGDAPEVSRIETVELR